MRGLIAVRHRLGPSTLSGAGTGFFVEEAVRAGRVIIAPGEVRRSFSLAEIFGPRPPPDADASVVWFEDQCVVADGRPDDWFINHAFDANGLWHLGFVFARRDLASGEELFLDYRHLLAPGFEADFKDAATGRAVVGLDWRRGLASTAAELAALMNGATGAMGREEAGG